MALILQDFLSLFCAILLLLILYVLFKICKAVRQREPVAIDQHDRELERRPEVIRNGQRRWRGERKPQCSDKKKLCHWTWWTSRLIQLFACSIYSQKEHFLLLRKFFCRLIILLHNPQENAMNCHGILSIIRFTKKDTYIDGFNEAGIMKYFFYFSIIKCSGRTKIYHYSVS